MKLLVLSSDFGDQDGYVGAMKGVALGINSQITLVDLAHHLIPFDIARASWVLATAYENFPHGTVFLTVVDPGVGGERLPILIETERHYFIGPDNGVFTLALQKEKIRRIVHLREEKFFLTNPSATFHGRDLFAPVAAHLLLGVPPEEFGPTLSTYTTLPELTPQLSGEGLLGRVLTIDRFGNVITNFSRDFLETHVPPEKKMTQIEIGSSTKKHTLAFPSGDWRKLNSHYAQETTGKPFLLFGSHAYLEIAMNQDSAARHLNLVGNEPLFCPWLHR